MRQGEWWRIITLGFLHDYSGLAHIVLNMMALYYLGRLMEAFQGRWRLAAYFLFAIVTGNLAALWWDPFRPCVRGIGRDLRAAGRDGRDDPLPSPRLSAGDLAEPQEALVSTLLINVLVSFVPRVAVSAHLGGLIGGFVLGLVISRSPTRRNRRRLRRDWPPPSCWARRRLSVPTRSAPSHRRTGRNSPAGSRSTMT